MNTSDFFSCEACSTTGHLNNLRHRLTMPGDYCKVCAGYEKCAACGEMCSAVLADFKEDVHNIICNDCAPDYHEVKKYIKPIYSFKKQQHESRI